MNLEGHLSECPFRELLSILTNRRETGRLQIDFEKAFGVLHLKDGRIINATLGPLKGLAAVRVALFLKEASFAFDDTVAIAVEANITDSDHRQIVTRLLGLPPHDGEEIETDPLPMAALFDTDGIRPPGTSRLAVSENIRGHILLAAKEALIYVHSHTRAVSIAVILMLLVPIVVAIAVTFPTDDGRQRAMGLVPGSDNHRMGPANPLGSAKQGESSALPADYAVYTDQKPIANPEPTGEVRQVSSSTTTAEMNSNQEPPALRTDKVLPKEASAKVIAVVMHIEEGRISEAYVRDHHPGLEAFEATAIRLARQRRYPTEKVGTETIFVTVSANQ